MYSFIGFLDSFVTTSSRYTGMASRSRRLDTAILHHVYPKVNEIQNAKGTQD